MINNINNTVETNKNTQYFKNKQTPFKGNGLSVGVKLLDGFIKSQENLSSTRFIQDTVTNWCPKVVFSRSKADFAAFLPPSSHGIFLCICVFLCPKFPLPLRILVLIVGFRPSLAQYELILI